MTQKLRPGWHRVPRWIFQPCDLTTDQRFLLLYYSSHDLSRWLFKVDRILADLGWSRNTYFKIAKQLESKGLIKRKTEYGIDEESGKKIPIGSRISVNAPDLSTKNGIQKNGPEYQKPGSSKLGLIRDSTSKGGTQTFDVIDDGDVVDLQAERLRKNRKPSCG